MADSTTAATTAHTVYDVLKDFQPALAALIALLAASLAYRGAMAKVALDREDSERQRTADRLGLYLRLGAQLRRLQGELRRIALAADAGLNEGRADSSEVPWKPTDYSFEGDFDEIENAWKALHLMPPPSFPHVEVIRTRLHAVIETTKANRVKSAVPTWNLQLYRAQIQDLTEHSDELIRVLAEAVVALRKFG